MLLVVPCCRDGLEKVEMAFGVGELLDLFELQASVFVGNDLSDENHFAVHVYPDRGLGPASELWQMNGVSLSRVGPNILDTNVGDDLPPGSFYDGMDGRLWGKFSWGKGVRIWVTCLAVDPKTHRLCDVLKILLLRLLRLANRSGVGDTTMVLVQELPNVSHVSLFKSLTK